MLNIPENGNASLAGGFSWCNGSRVFLSPERSLYHGSCVHCQVFIICCDSWNTFTPRHNWLEGNHTIGRLLKPHIENTIFVNFDARNTLIAEKNSVVQRMFSVFSFIWTVLYLSFSSHCIVTSRWVGMEHYRLWLRSWLKGTSGRKLTSQQWWRGEDFLERSQMGWKGSTTGEEMEQCVLSLCI